MRKSLPGNNTLSKLAVRALLLTALALGGELAHADTYGNPDPDAPTNISDALPSVVRSEPYLNQVNQEPAPVRETPAYDPSPVAVGGGSRYASQIHAAALANNVEAALIRAVISVESGYNPSATSMAGAVGLMQLMPGTAKRYHVKDRHNPEQNIHGGAQYLRDLLRLFDNDLHLAIAAYHAGEHAVRKYGNRVPPYRTTLAFVTRVMMFYKRYSTGYDSAEETGYRRFSTVVPKKPAQTRASRT